MSSSETIRKRKMIDPVVIANIISKPRTEPTLVVPKHEEAHSNSQEEKTYNSHLFLAFTIELDRSGSVAVKKYLHSNEPVVIIRNLSRPIAKILRYLAEVRKSTIEDMSTKLGINENTVYANLLKLEKAGLVRLNKIGRIIVAEVATNFTLLIYDKAGDEELLQKIRTERGKYETILKLLGKYLLELGEHARGQVVTFRASNFRKWCEERIYDQDIVKMLKSSIITLFINRLFTILAEKYPQYVENILKRGNGMRILLKSREIPNIVKALFCNILGMEDLYRQVIEEYRRETEASTDVRKVRVYTSGGVKTLDVDIVDEDEQ